MRRSMPDASASTLSSLKRAAKDLLIYLSLSAVMSALNLAIYVAYFLVAQPKYTFLSGNSLLAILFVVESFGCFYWTCVRGRRAPDLVSFRFATSCIVTGLVALYGLHATVFTIVERSVSINVMRFLVAGESQPYDKIERNFIDTFVYRDKAVCKRLDEQVHLGNVALENGRYSITSKGLRTFTVLDSATHITADKNPKNAVSCQ